VDDGTLPRDPTAQHCWLRVDLTPLGSKVLRVTGAGSQTEITVYAADGRVLASMRERRDRDQAIVGSRGVLFPTLRPELGRLDLRIYRHTSPLRVEAADLVESVQAQRNADFATVATGALWSVLALAALVLGFVNRDRAQFVLSAALGWLALGAWSDLSSSLDPRFAAPGGTGYIWLTGFQQFGLLAAAQVLRLRERAPRWNRAMLGCRGTVLRTSSVLHEGRLGGVVVCVVVRERVPADGRRGYRRFVACVADGVSRRSAGEPPLHHRPVGVGPNQLFRRTRVAVPPGRL
jgi:hypothetical protein